MSLHAALWEAALDNLATPAIDVKHARYLKGKTDGLLTACLLALGTGVDDDLLERLRENLIADLGRREDT